MNALETVGLCKSFGGFEVISDLDFNVSPGERHAVIGPNGAGKTTLFNLITGWIGPTRGEIFIHGQARTGASPQEVTRAGLSRSFQRNMLLEGLSVFENIRLACQAFDPSRRGVFRPTRRHSAVVRAAERIAHQVLLDDVLTRPVSQLSYGQKRQLEVAIALSSQPRILLLDEPAAGTSPAERQRLVQLVKDLPRDITVLLVEHDMDVVFGIADRITVLSYGRMLASGTPSDVRANAAVREAYLGKRAHAEPA